MSVDLLRRILSRRKTDAVVSDVVDHVEALEEGHAVDEVETNSLRGAEIVDNEIQMMRAPADCSVELQRWLLLERSLSKCGYGKHRTTYCAWPDLGVGGQLVSDLKNKYVYNQRGWVDEAPSALNWALTPPIWK